MFFFFNDTATTEIYTLSLHDALPILVLGEAGVHRTCLDAGIAVDALLRVDVQHLDLVVIGLVGSRVDADRKSTRLNSSHANISYAVFCLKKKQIYVYYHLIDDTFTND